MLHEKMKKMLDKKKDLHPAEKKAKMDVASALRDDMADEMRNKLGGMKKVSVMAPDKQGLQQGLETAKQLTAAAPQEDDASDEGYDDGGQVADPDKLQSAQDSMRKAFGYHDGAEVNEQDPAEAEKDYEGEEGHDQMDEPHSEAEKYNDEALDDEDENEFHGLDMDELNSKLEKLMKMKSKMEQK